MIRKKFRYYIDLAQVYLPKEGKSKLYDYYLSLINYYKGYYPEALQMLQRTDMEPYSDVGICLLKFMQKWTLIPRLYSN